MVRLSLLVLLLSGCAFASQTCVTPDEFCPTITFSINGSDFSNIFTVTPVVPGQEYSISANAPDVDGFSVVFTATTHPDPVIDFGMSFGANADPLIFASITSPYFGDAPDFSEFGNALAGSFSGTGMAGSLLNPSDGQLYEEEFLVNGVAVDFENLGGAKPDFTGGPFPNSGNFTMELGFNITDDSVLNVQGFAGGPIPEPATIGFVGAGALLLATAVRRRARRA